MTAPLPPAETDPVCPKCGTGGGLVRWHALPILGASDCAAPCGAGEHLCLTCGRCGYVRATQAMDGPL